MVMKMFLLSPFIFLFMLLLVCFPSLSLALPSSHRMAFRHTRNPESATCAYESNV